MHPGIAKVGGSFVMPYKGYLKASELEPSNEHVRQNIEKTLGYQKEAG